MNSNALFIEMPHAHRIRVTTVYSVLCFFLLIAFRPGAGQAFAQIQATAGLAGKNILVLHSHEANAPVFWGTDKGLAETLESGGISSLNQFFESLNLRQNPGAEYRKLLVEQMRARYGRRKLDMIITMYPEALEFVLKDCQDVLPHVPILALYLPQNQGVPGTDPRIIRHLSRLNITGTLEVALKLVPGAKRVYMVGGAHEVDRAIEAQARADLKKWESRLEFIYLSHLAFEDVLAMVSSVPPHSIILFLTYTQDVTGKNYTNPIVLKRLRQVSAAPIFGLIDYNLSDVMVGGRLINFEQTGVHAGQMVLKILGGTRVSENTQAILDVPPIPIFDWSQLRHWDLNENDLPEESIIKNKQSTFYDFQYYIIGVIGFCLVESALIIFLVVQRRRKKSAEDSLRKAVEKYRNIFDGAVEGLFETSTQGQPLTVNPALANTLGYDSPGELIAKIRNVGNQVYADPDKRLEFMELIEKQDVVHGFECQMLRQDGTRIWASLSGRKVCDPDGKTLYYSGFLEDITKRKLAEENLAEQLLFERMISELLSHFMNLSIDAVDSEINKWLRGFTEFFKADRCSIGIFTEDQTQLVLAFDYHLAEVEPAPKLLLAEQLPWYMEQLIQGNTVVINRVNDFPPEAQNERRLCLTKGMKSFLSMPLIAGHKTLGSCALVSITKERVWPRHLLQRFRLISNLFANAIERKQVIEATRKSDEILLQSEKELRLLAGRLIHNQEEERSRLARELHDDLVQRLAVFAINIGRLELELKDQPASVQVMLSEMKHDMVKISGDVHNLSRRLHPSILDDLGLIRAIESQCTNFSKREGTEVVFRHENIHSVIPKDISLSLYRMIQEGLSNISKHACAEHISISLTGNDHDILLSIQDDGIGFDSAVVKAKPGLGLSSIRERVRLFQGEHSINSQPGKGTRITVRVPLQGLMKEGE
ncbi:MAG: PAS domain S-box protein [Thermodesulfobacteriota bacterium]